MEENLTEIQEDSFINIDNIKYKTLLTRKYLSRKPYQAVNPKIVMSFIPGTIVKVYVKVGDKVKKGDKLIVLEAMKMNNELLSPQNGTIKAIKVEAGERVVKSQVLLELK